MKHVSNGVWDEVLHSSLSPFTPGRLSPIRDDDTVYSCGDVAVWRGRRCSLSMIRIGLILVQFLVPSALCSIFRTFAARSCVRACPTVALCVNHCAHESRPFGLENHQQSRRDSPGHEKKWGKTLETFFDHSFFVPVPCGRMGGGYG